MDLKILGQKIRDYRTSLNMRQEDLANGIVTRAYISQIEKGNASPSFDILSKLAERLKCSVSSLLSDSKETVDEFTTISAQLYQAEWCLDHTMYKEFLTIMEAFEASPLEPSTKCKLDFLYGRYYWEVKKFEASDEHLESCIQQSFPSDFETRAKAHNLHGQVLFRLDRKQEALLSLNNALQLSKQFVLDKLLHIDILLNLGVFHCHLDEVTSALMYLLDAYQISKSNNTFFKSGEILMTLGVCYKKIGNLEEARLHYTNSLKFFDETNNERLKAGIFVNLAIIHHKNKDYTQTKKYLEDAIQIYSSLADLRGLANAKVELAEMYVSTQQLVEAKQLCNELFLLDIDLELKAQLHVLLGKIHSSTRNLSQSLDHFFQAKIIYLQGGMKKKLNELYLAIGETYYVEKDFESAAYYYRQGIGI